MSCLELLLALILFKSENLSFSLGFYPLRESLQTTDTLGKPWPHCSRISVVRAARRRHLAKARVMTRWIIVWEKKRKIESRTNVPIRKLNYINSLC